MNNLFFKLKLFKVILLLSLFLSDKSFANPRDEIKRKLDEGELYVFSKDSYNLAGCVKSDDKTLLAVTESTEKALTDLETVGVIDHPRSGLSCTDSPVLSPDTLTERNLSLRINSFFTKNFFSIKPTLTPTEEFTKYLSSIGRFLNTTRASDGSYTAVFGLNFKSDTHRESLESLGDHSSKMVKMRASGSPVSEIGSPASEIGSPRGTSTEHEIFTSFMAGIGAHGSYPQFEDFACRYKKDKWQNIRTLAISGALTASSVGLSAASATSAMSLNPAISAGIAGATLALGNLIERYNNRYKRKRSLESLLPSEVFAYTEEQKAALRMAINNAEREFETAALDLKRETGMSALETISSEVLGTWAAVDQFSNWIPFVGSLPFQVKGVVNYGSALFKGIKYGHAITSETTEDDLNVLIQIEKSKSVVLSESVHQKDNEIKILLDEYSKLLSSKDLNASQKINVLYNVDQLCRVASDSIFKLFRKAVLWKDECEKHLESLRTRVRKNDQKRGRELLEIEQKIIR